jgi:hypothetical protein
LNRVENNDVARSRDVESGSFFRQPGEPGFDSLEGQAGGDPVPGLRRPRLIGQQRLGVGSHCRVRPHLSCREHLNLLDRIDRALRPDCEGADLIDIVTPELDSECLCSLRREHIHNATANCELAPRLDTVGAVVTVDRQLGNKPIETMLLPRHHRYRLEF